MPSAKKPTAPAKPAAKAPAKEAAKPAAKAPAKAAGKPEPKGESKATKAPNVGTPARAATKTKAGQKEEAVPTKNPAPTAVDTDAKLEKVAGRDTIAQIEIVKDGHFFIARTETEAGGKEYKNTVFEDLLTEMVITLQEQLVDK